MRVALATTFLCLGLTACGVPRSDPQVTVENARITLPAVKGRPGAGYFDLKGSGQPLRLTAVTSPRVQRIELHESMGGHGAMRMQPLNDAGFPADGRLIFAPGGKHAMLFGVDPALKVGDRLPLTLTFDRAPAVTVEAQVLGPGGGHAGH